MMMLRGRLDPGGHCGWDVCVVVLLAEAARAGGSAPAGIRPALQGAPRKSNTRSNQTNKKSYPGSFHFLGLTM